MARMCYPPSNRRRISWCAGCVDCRSQRRYRPRHRRDIRKEQECKTLLSGVRYPFINPRLDSSDKNSKETP